MDGELTSAGGLPIVEKAEGAGIDFVSSVRSYRVDAGGTATEIPI